MWYNNIPIPNRSCDAILSATNCSILLHTILPSVAYAEALPPEYEVTQVCANEDADDEVSVVVHGQQHDKVRDSECTHVQCRPDRLLYNAWSELARCHRHGAASNWRLLRGRILSHAVVIRRGGSEGTGRRGNECLGVLLNDEAVVLLGRAAQELEEDDEEDDADAGTGKHGFGAYVPGLCDETCVDDVPVPQHLSERVC
jgi:hypothetical protein